MSFVVYETGRKLGVKMVEKESTARGLVTKNNKAMVWETLSGYTLKRQWNYCSWAEFEAIARASKRPGYSNYHNF
jgi:hypothetical protein